MSNASKMSPQAKSWSNVSVGERKKGVACLHMILNGATAVLFPQQSGHLLSALKDAIRNNSITPVQAELDVQFDERCPTYEEWRTFYLIPPALKQYQDAKQSKSRDEKVRILSSMVTPLYISSFKGNFKKKKSYISFVNRCFI